MKLIEHDFVASLLIV